LKTMSTVNAYIGKFNKWVVTKIAVHTMRLSLWVMGRLLLRIATTLKRSDEAVAAPLAYPGEVAATPLVPSGEPLTERLRRQVYDEENRTLWAWFRGYYEALSAGGSRKVFLPPQPGLGLISESKWTVLVSSPKDLPGGRARKTLVSLYDVLALCGVEECRREMVLAHELATVDARRREANLGLTGRVSLSLERQLIRVGEFVPDHSSRHGGGDSEPTRSQNPRAYRCVDIHVVGDLGDSQGGEGDDLYDPPFKPPKHYILGCYASVAGEPHDRRIVVMGTDRRWTVSDSRVRPLPENEDIDVRYLPKTFVSPQKAFVEGHAHLRLAKRNGAPPPNFEV
jgi:hypothetical protein